MSSLRWLACVVRSRDDCDASADPIRSADTRRRSGRRTRREWRPPAHRARHSPQAQNPQLPNSPTVIHTRQSHLLRSAADCDEQRHPVAAPMRCSPLDVGGPPLRQRARPVALPAKPRPLRPDRSAHAGRRFGSLATICWPTAVGPAGHEDDCSRRRRRRAADPMLTVAAPRAPSPSTLDRRRPTRHEAPVRRPPCPARPLQQRATSRPIRSTTTCLTTRAPSRASTATSISTQRSGRSSNGACRCT